MKRCGRAAAVGILVLGASLGACTSGDGDGQRAVPSAEATTTTSIVVGDDLVEVLGCDPELTTDESAWYFGEHPDRYGDCERDGRFVARIAWYDDEDLVDVVASEYERFAVHPPFGDCPDGGKIRLQTWAIAGPDWFAVAISEDRAMEIVEVTGAQLTGASPTPGPPPSFLLPFGEQC